SHAEVEVLRPAQAERGARVGVVDLAVGGVREEGAAQGVEAGGLQPGAVGGADAEAADPVGARGPPDALAVDEEVGEALRLVALVRLPGAAVLLRGAPCGHE